MFGSGTIVKMVTVLDKDQKYAEVRHELSDDRLQLFVILLCVN